MKQKETPNKETAPANPEEKAPATEKDKPKQPSGSKKKSAAHKRGLPVSTGCYRIESYFAPRPAVKVVEQEKKKDGGAEKKPEGSAPKILLEPVAVAKKELNSGAPPKEIVRNMPKAKVKAKKKNKNKGKKPVPSSNNKNKDPKKSKPKPKQSSGAAKCPIRSKQELEAFKIFSTN